MATLIWDESKNRIYEAGLDQGVLFPFQAAAVAWSGLISIDEVNANQEATPEYFEGVRFKTSLSKADFQANLSALSAPVEFAPCEGKLELYPGFYATNQPKELFGLSYRTFIGNPLEGLDYGYKIHLIYNALACSEERSHQTYNATTDPVVHRWLIRSVPYYKRDYIWFSSEDNLNLQHELLGFHPISHLIVSSKSVEPQNLELLENVLYGTSTTDPELPSPTEVLELIR